MKISFLACFIRALLRLVLGYTGLGYRPTMVALQHTSSKYSGTVLSDVEDFEATDTELLSHLPEILTIPTLLF
jgi:hypothetical protein